MSELTIKAKNFVIQFLLENLSSNLVFHNLNHTCEVVNAVKEIGEYSDLSEKEMDILTISAWFHDCGYAYAYEGHEEESKRIAFDFLKAHNCESTFTEKVLQCIDATKFPQKPLSLCERIICDADMYHLTKPNYLRYEQLLRHEQILYGINKCGSDLEWKAENFKFLTTHTYCSLYGQEILSKFKKINVDSILFD